MKVRYIEHHPDEWLVGVAGLTPEQNGIYRTICDLIASTGGPIPADDERLFRIIKANRSRINRVISELEVAQKLERSDGKLTQKRVISELERAENRSKIGRDRVAKRWNIKGLDDTDGNTRARNKTKNQEPRTINQETRASRALSTAEAFDRWWEGYPEKTGKGAAKKSFSRALEKTSIDQLIAGLERYKATKPITRPWCNPATWLNQERWLDVPAPFNGNGRTNPLNDSGLLDGPTEPPPTLEGFKFPMGRAH